MSILKPVIFSVNSFAAAMLALFVALGLGLPNPYWAMLTVYIVSQPLAGPVRSKAVYRLTGTVVGAAAAVAFVPNLVNAPELLCLGIALWVGLCLGISLLDRTPRSYLFMLAGYTAALIGFPTVNNPQAVFDVAVARVEEIALGITCATVIHSVFMPQGLDSVLTGRIRGFMQDAQNWISEALTGRHDPSNRMAHKLGADVTELHILSTHLPYDISDFQTRTQEVRALAKQMAMLLPLAGTVGDRLYVLREQGGPLSAASEALIADVTAWVEAGPEALLHDADLLIARARALEPELGPSPTWADLLSANFHDRLAALIEVYRDCRILARSLVLGHSLPAGLDEHIATTNAQPLHLDYGRAATAGLAAVAAVLAVCAFWILTAWSNGAEAAMLTAVFVSLFAAMDEPAKAIDSFALSTVPSMLLAGIYLFGIMPALHSFPMLVLALAPFLLVCGFRLANPALMPSTLPLIINVSGMLAIQETFRADFQQFINGGIAMAGGAIAASIVTRLIRSAGAEFSVRRLMMLTWRDLATLASGPRLPPRGAWIHRMVDRAGLLGPRLDASGSARDLIRDSLGELRVGLNIMALRHLQADAAQEIRRIIAKLLDELAIYFRARAKGLAVDPSPQLLEALDRAVAGLGAMNPGGVRRSALLALVGLRRALFPNNLTFAGESNAS